MLTLAQLNKIMPNAGSRAEQFIVPLNQAMEQFQINTKIRQAAFLANIAHESAQLTCMEENLNYSAAALTRVWPSRFPASIATFYERQPQKIANRAYANRMGNGDEDSGDGWRYRGAGLFELTGADNQTACAKYFNMSKEDMPAWLRTPLGACLSAGWFWQRAAVDQNADSGDFDGVCDKINIGRKTSRVGDAIGYADRRHFYDIALQVMA